MLAPRQPMLTSLTPPAGSINQACVQIREDFVDSRRLYSLAVFILISGDHANPLADQTGIIYSLATPGDCVSLSESPCFSFFFPYVFLFFHFFFPSKLSHLIGSFVRSEAFCVDFLEGKLPIRMSVHQSVCTYLYHHSSQYTFCQFMSGTLKA